jgi:hypothetical protein
VFIRLHFWRVDDEHSELGSKPLSMVLLDASRIRRLLGSAVGKTPSRPMLATCSSVRFARTLKSDGRNDSGEPERSRVLSEY